MGEAKWRKRHDPTFGKVPGLHMQSRMQFVPGGATQVLRASELPAELPQDGRGLVISPPLRITGDRIEISSTIDAQELRYALLFWDRLALPTNNIIHVEPGDDATYLEQAGVLSTVHFKAQGNGAKAIAMAQVTALRELDASRPGAWAMAQGERSFMLDNGDLEAGRGMLVELHRAIPVPDKDVPLAELLEFKEKRRPELLALRTEVESLYEGVQSAGDGDLAFRSRLERIQRFSQDAITVSKESGLKFRLPSIGISFRPFAIMKGGVEGYKLAEEKMPGHGPFGALVGAVCGAITFKDGDAIKGLRESTKPYRYVAQYHDEVF